MADTNTPAEPELTDDQMRALTPQQLQSHYNRYTGKAQPGDVPLPPLQKPEPELSDEELNKLTPEQLQELHSRVLGKEKGNLPSAWEDVPKGVGVGALQGTEKTIT